MSTLLAIEKTISSFQELRDCLGLHRATDNAFFSEWQSWTANRKQDDQPFLDHLWQRYQNYYNAGLLTEGTVLFALVASLLEHLGFQDLPFFVRSEIPVRVEIEDRDEVYQGRVDVLVVRERLWVLTVEAKRSRFAADIALPQCLADMAAAAEKPVLGMVTNGSEFMFCKLENWVYDFSDPFSLLSRQNRLCEVAAILTSLKEFLA
ncbi:MAG: type I restriction endonuclease subunit R [Cyanobacteria bacterium J06626_18]